MKLSQLKSNPNNPRLINTDKFKKLVQSIKDFPEMLEKRPIVCVTDTDGMLYPLGGNMRLKALQELKFKDIPDTWITMADDWNIEQKKEFTIKDNVGFGDWDWDTLANEWDAEDLDKWGLDVPIKKELNEEDLFDIEIPFYTPSEIQPEINELANLDKTKTLIKKIDLLKIDNELKEILKIRASFFTDFNFQKIADFYSKQNKDVKEIFEDLGMVILAPKEALQKGFIELSENVFEL
jgi:ParB-like chromosome segregation protein Spo0J